jgi:hypothetical protein
MVSSEITAINTEFLLSSRIDLATAGTIEMSRGGYATMTGSLDTKVILRPRFLRGAKQDGTVQRVATVYIDGTEYRVVAPPEATGDVLEWLPHCSVRQVDSFNVEVKFKMLSALLPSKW